MPNTSDPVITPKSPPTTLTKAVIADQHGVSDLLIEAVLVKGIFYSAGIPSGQRKGFGQQV